MHYVRCTLFGEDGGEDTNYAVYMPLYVNVHILPSIRGQETRVAVDTTDSRLRFTSLKKRLDITRVRQTPFRPWAGICISPYSTSLPLDLLSYYAPRTLPPKKKAFDQILRASRPTPSSLSQTLTPPQPSHLTLWLSCIRVTSRGQESIP